MITMNWIPIGLNWTILFKCLEMTFVVIWRYINKTELNWIEYWSFREICWNQGNVFFHKLILQQDNARRHSAQLQTTWPHRHSVCVCVCVWLACLQSRSVSYWKCMMHEEENQTTAEQLKCSFQEHRFLLKYSNNFYSQFPNGSIMQLKGSIMLQNGKYASLPTFLGGYVVASNSRLVYIF